MTSILIQKGRGCESEDDPMSALSIEHPAPGTVLLRFNRPERLNAIDQALADEFRLACDRLETDPDARVVVLTGTGRGFCSGLDMRDFGPGMPGDEASALEKLRFQEAMAGLPDRIRNLPQPVIAAVNGPAVGGGLALVLAADIRICGASASFGNAAIRIGLTGAEMGMSYHLPRVVGTSVAAEWMLTGRKVTAEEAHQRGLVSSLVEDGQLMEHALDLAGQMAALSPLAVQLTKRALQTNVDAPGLAAALEVENRNQLIAHATDEAAAARAGWTDPKERPA
jgi:enoyl-CoA hydratase/carnithine racemase